MHRQGSGEGICSGHSKRIQPRGMGYISDFCFPDMNGKLIPLQANKSVTPIDLLLTHAQNQLTLHIAQPCCRCTSSETTSIDKRQFILEIHTTNWSQVFNSNSGRQKTVKPGLNLMKENNFQPNSFTCSQNKDVSRYGKQANKHHSILLVLSFFYR